MNIVIERGKTVLLKDMPEWSICLDGYTQGPETDPENHRFSFDHHSGCLRFCTTAACMQAHTAILLGLDPENYTVYANDVDADVCMAIWCLKNPDRCKEPLVEKLVNAVGKMDMHAGAISCNGMSKTVEYICSPEVDSKRNQDYYKLSNDGLKSILEAVLHRIDLYVNGEASIEVAKQQKFVDFKILRNENNWAVIESSDPHSLTNIFAAGFDRFILKRPQDDGSLAITIAKRSDFIDGFSLEKIYSELNKLEPGWNGSSSIGGAPRNPDGSRSKLSLETIIQVIDDVVLGKI